MRSPIIVKPRHTGGPAARSRTNASGFTLIELLVVIAIIGILTSVTLPALMSARDTARRLECAGNLTKIGLALQDYVAAYEVFPSGTVAESGPIQNIAEGLHQSWMTRILGYLDHPTAQREVDFSASVYGRENAKVRRLYIAGYICPSELREDFKFPSSSYAGCQNDVEAPIDVGNNGCFFLDSQLRLDDLVDGRQQTLLVGEKTIEPGDLGWMSGTSATLRNAGRALDADFAYENGAADEAAQGGENGGNEAADPLYVGGFGGAHVEGLNFLFADGAVQFLDRFIDVRLLQQLANRDDGAPLSWPQQ